MATKAGRSDRLTFSTSMIRFCIFLAGNFWAVLAEPVFVGVRRPFAENRTSQSVERLASILSSEFCLLNSDFLPQPVWFRLRRVRFTHA